MPGAALAGSIILNRDWFGQMAPLPPPDLGKGVMLVRRGGCLLSYRCLASSPPCDRPKTAVRGHRARLVRGHRLASLASPGWSALSKPKLPGPNNLELDHPSLPVQGSVSPRSCVPLSNSLPSITIPQPPYSGLFINPSVSQSDASPSGITLYKST